MTTINLSDDLVEKAKKYAHVYNRSTPKQIEYWAKIGRACEDNPDLPFGFIKDILLAVDEESIPFDFSELDE
mgnify:CR=1 FL=1|tara:strand:+ start:2425 stop:2640 length:216 start_codon:yes stop_codon:yes gene_type:complete